MKSKNKTITKTLTKQKEKNPGVLKSALLESLRQINNSRFMFIILFFTQLIFFTIMAFIFYNYSIKIMTYREAILAPLNAGVLENVSVFATESVGIMENYSLLIQNLLIWLVASFVVYLFVNGINWELTYGLFNRRFSYFRYLRKYITYGAICIIPGFISIVVILHLLINLLPEIALALSIIIWAIIAYFMYISFGLIDNNELSPIEIKSHFQKTVKFGIKHWKTFVLTDILVCIPISIIITLIALFSETMPMPILIFLLLLPAVIINIGRLMFINISKNLEGGKK